MKRKTETSTFGILPPAPPPKSKIVIHTSDNGGWFASVTLGNHMVLSDVMDLEAEARIRGQEILRAMQARFGS